MSRSCDEYRLATGLVPRPGGQTRRVSAGLIALFASCFFPVPSSLAAADPGPAEGPIRKLTGKHITLLTDLPSAEAIDELPAVFDKAVPQYCAYFGVSASRCENWRVTGCVMKDQAVFRRLGLLPERIPPFSNGYSYSLDLWICDQPSDYYRRHLLLHEGVHSFMNSILGATGPPWYAEGLAELLGTHRWKDGQLTLGSFPANREEVPMWGRIKIVRDAFAARHAKRFADVLAYDPRTQPGNEFYGWCWALAAFLDGHPRYQARFRKLPQWVRQLDLTERFQRLMGEDWSRVAEEWQVFVADLEYGYDLRRTAIDFAPGQPLAPGGTRITVHADRGWQNAGVILEAGVKYRLRAAGRYQVADKPQIWWSEPNGVSIRYYRGRPLGILLAVVRPDPPVPGPSPWLSPVSIGLGGELAPKHSGTLFLRINDSAAELNDNAGTLAVEVKEAGETKDER